MKTFKTLVTLLLVAGAALSARCDSWTTTAPMNIAREVHTATLLPNGKVLVTGGYNYTNGGQVLSSCELYDPVTGAWTPTSSMKTARQKHTATLLPNGKAMVAGSVDINGNVLASAELYDPATGTWTPTGSMNSPRVTHTATLLTNGMVLVAGGDTNVSPYIPAPDAELYIPASGTWVPTGSMNIARVYHTATLLPNGQVLVAGGYNIAAGGYLDSSEIYDPTSGIWTLTTNSLNNAREQHTATLLPNGQVLVAGGLGISNGFVANLASAEVYDPASGFWILTGSMNFSRVNHTAALLLNRKVLVAGGGGGAATELYDPASGNWTIAAPMSTSRTFHTETLLANGEVLVAGGLSGINILASAEVYGPSIAPPLSVNLSGNTVTVWWQNVSGWTLQQNTSLANAVGWSDSSGVTNANGTNYLSVTLPVGNCFYRLIGQ